MKLVPLADRVVLKQSTPEEKTKSGIILTSQSQEKPQQAEVVAVGPGGMVDGKEITLAAKGYTSSDDGKELRSNIYNQWVDKLPDDAVSTEGALVVDGNPTDAAADYSPCIVNLDDFATWTTVEVNFTVSGIE